MRSCEKRYDYCYALDTFSPRGDKSGTYHHGHLACFSQSRCSKLNLSTSLMETPLLLTLKLFHSKDGFHTRKHHWWSYVMQISFSIGSYDRSDTKWSYSTVHRSDLVFWAQYGAGYLRFPWAVLIILVNAFPKSLINSCALWAYVTTKFAVGAKLHMGCGALRPHVLSLWRERRVSLFVNTHLESCLSQWHWVNVPV